MPIHSASSRKKLLECHDDIQQLVQVVSDRMSLLVICGFRGKPEQNEAFSTGKSKLSWPHSKHNCVPSLAVDLAPLQPDGKLSWNDIHLFKELGRVMFEEADKMNIKIRWGGNFVSFKDSVHFELVKPVQEFDSVD